MKDAIQNPGPFQPLGRPIIVTLGMGDWLHIAAGLILLAEASRQGDTKDFQGKAKEIMRQVRGAGNVRSLPNSEGAAGETDRPDGREPSSS